MIRHLLLSTVAVVASAASTSASAQSVYSFGDSLSDIGSVNQISLGLVAGSDYFNGRFSNGYVWVDYLSALSARAEQETLQGLIGPFFTASDIGYNFAHGGAVTGELSPNVDTSLFGDDLAFLSQIGPFRTTDQAQHFRDQNVLFGQRAFIVNPRDFATISAGGNDYFNGETDVGRVVGNLLTAVSYIQQGGINNILMLDVPWVGETPGSVLTSERDQLNALSEQHNALLRSEAEAYEAANPNAFIAIVPAARLFEIAILDATTNGGALLGFTNVGPNGSSSGTCLGDGLVLSACPDSYLFYDDVHPTARAHALLADAAVATVRAKLAGDALPLSSSRSTKQVAATGNGVIASRFASFRAGRTNSGWVTSPVEAFLSGAEVGTNALQFSTTGPIELSAESGLATFNFSSGSRLDQPTDLQRANLGTARAQTLTINEGEFIQSFGADYLSTENFAVGVMISHAEFDRPQTWAFTEDEVTAFTVYGTWFRGNLSVDGLIRSTRGRHSYQRSTAFSALPTLTGDATTQLTEQRLSASYDLLQLGSVGFAAVGRASRGELDIVELQESGTMGLFEREAPDGAEQGYAAYVGGKATIDLPKGRGQFFMEGGQYHASNQMLGHSLLFDDGALLTDAVDDISVVSRFGTSPRDGQYAEVGLSFRMSENVLLTGRAASVGNTQHSDTIADISLAWRF